MHDQGDESPPSPESPPQDRGVWKRLAVAFVLILGVAWLCYWLLPRVGADVPWWVPILCFLVIVASVIVRRLDSGDDGQDQDGDGGVAGRIGPGGFSGSDEV